MVDASANPVTGETVPETGLRSVIAGGTASMGVAVFLQRLLAFSGAVIAARVGGPPVLGTYALVIGTSGAVASYAGMDIQTVVSHFAGRWGPGTSQRARASRLLVLYTAGAGLIAALVLVVAARPISVSLLGSPRFENMLRLSAACAVSLIAFQALFGFFVGRYEFRRLLLLSTISGGLLFIGLAITASIGVPSMLVAFTAAHAVAVGVAMLRRRGPRQPSGPADEELPRFRQIAAYGVTLLLGGIGVTAASWYMAALLTRGDTDGGQMGLYTAAQQLNTIAVIVPTLLGQLVVPILTRARETKDHVRIIDSSSYLSTSVSVIMGALLLTFLPVLLRAWGPGFRSAELPAAFVIAAAIVQMSNAALWSHLLVRAPKRLGVINVGWSVALAILATILIPPWQASGAAFAWLAAYSLTQPFVLWANVRLLGRDVRFVKYWASAAAIGGSLLALSALRVRAPEWSMELTALLAAVSGVAIFFLWMEGRRQGILPATLSGWRQVGAQAWAQIVRGSAK